MAAACDGSDFCEELRGGRDTPFSRTYSDPPSRILARGKHAAVLVDLAPMVVGHLLVVPLSHVRSFGLLPEEAWDEAVQLRNEANGILSARVGPAVVLEHGSDISHSGGGCIEHAHWHLVPRIDPGAVLDSFRRRGLVGRSVEVLRPVLRGLAESGSAYFYVGDLSGENPLHTVFSDRLPAAEHRMLRRVVADCLGPNAPPDDWSLPRRALFSDTWDTLADAPWRRVDGETA